MCRWLAYSGSTISISSLVTQPSHSLIDQSRAARQNSVGTNGDGFGIGWYGAGSTPGIYHDIQPAWNDSNIRNIAAHIKSPIFFAHVRPTSGSPVQRTNCHPFAFENWLFQHNGSVPEFSKLKRQLMFDVAPEFFGEIKGSTDSEVMFYLALTFGLRDDPKGGLERMIAHIEQLKTAAEVVDPITFSAALSDGTSLFSVRYSSHHNSPTLYHSKHAHALATLDDSYDPLPDNSIVIVSEPLDDLSDHWESVPESSLVTVRAGDVTLEDFSV